MKFEKFKIKILLILFIFFKKKHENSSSFRICSKKIMSNSLFKHLQTQINNLKTLFKTPIFEQQSLKIIFYCLKSMKEKIKLYELLYELSGNCNTLRINYINPLNLGKLDFNLFEISIDSDKSSFKETKITKQSVRIPVKEIPTIKEKLDAVSKKEESKDYYRIACACYESNFIPEYHNKTGCGNVLRINYNNSDSSNFEINISLDNPLNLTRRIKLKSAVQFSEIDKIKKSLDQIVLNHKLFEEKSQNN